jgi:phosphate:Na+ symporter
MRRALRDNPQMSSTAQLIDLLGAGALLLWGLRLIKTGILRGFGPNLRHAIARGTGNRLKAALSGLMATLALQSSTATAVITASFAERRLIDPRMGQAVMLGANVGTALTAAILSTDVHWLASAMILVGVVTYTSSRYARGRGIGSALLGLGLMLLALQLLGTITEPLRDSEAVQALLKSLTDAPVFAVLLAAGLAFVASSSLAAVLFVALLAQAGAVPPALVIVLVGGANLGGAIPPWLAVAKEGPAARRLTLSNLIVRASGAAAMTVLAGPLANLAGSWLPAGVPLAIVAHVGFNLVLLVVFLPLLGPVSRLAALLVRTPEDPNKAASYLDEKVLNSAPLALAGAARETLRIGDLVREMLEASFRGLLKDDPALETVLSSLDDRIDALQQSVKLYVARLDRASLDEDGNRRANEIISYAINLEHIGDIIDRGLGEQAVKRAQRHLAFSEDGLTEITQMYDKTVENLGLAQSVFLTGDPQLARVLMAAKVEIRRLEASSTSRHLERVRALRAEALDTSTLHLDIVRDLKRINAHLASVAISVLECRGELVESRVLPQGQQVQAN